jgi:hypothetical protein
MNGRNDYPSVSKVLKKFYKPFPSEEIALKKANGDVIKQQEYLLEWEQAGTYSTNLGSRVHYVLEKELIESQGNYKEVRKPIFECDLEQLMKSDKMISAGKKYIKLMEERGAVILDTEMVLGDPELGYVGQPDKVWLIENKEKNGIGLVITDWKSNKPKSFEENKFTERMYEPFQKYPNTALGHYYLQLPLYGRLLIKMLEGTKYEGMKLYGAIICHLLEEGYYQEYRVPKEIIDTVMNMNMKEYL